MTTPQQATPDVLELRPGSGATNPTYFQGWEGPAAPTSGAIVYQFPNGAPTAGQSMTMAAPGGGISAVTWGGPFASTGTLINVRTFTSGSASTYTPTAGTTAIDVEMLGCGGGGGGASYTSSSDSAWGGGGAASSYVEYFVSGVVAETHGDLFSLFDWWHGRQHPVQVPEEQAVTPRLRGMVARL